MKYKHYCNRIRGLLQIEMKGRDGCIIESVAGPPLIAACSNEVSSFGHDRTGGYRPPRLIRPFSCHSLPWLVAHRLAGGCDKNGGEGRRTEKNIFRAGFGGPGGGSDLRRGLSAHRRNEPTWGRGGRVGPAGIEPATFGLKVRCSAD